MTVYCVDDTIMAPLKCGTRYLRSLGLPYRNIHLTDADWYKAYDVVWKFIIIRNPLEHLKSALQTELLLLYNGHELWGGMTTESVLDKFISKDGCDHWSGSMYKMIYELWIDKNKIPKVIDLKDISYFVSSIGHYIPYYKDIYDFSSREIYFSKDEIFNMVRNDYPTHYSTLIEMMNDDAKYYNQFDIEIVKKNVI